MKSIQGQSCEAEFKAAIAMYGDDLDAYELKAWSFSFLNWSKFHWIFAIC